MAQVVGLSPSEVAGLDSGVLLQLEMRHGSDESRRILAEAALDVIERLGRFELAVAGRPGREAARQATTIAALSEEIGATELARAARAAADCQENGDATARAATAHRLVRTGEAALEALLGATIGI